MSDEQRPMLRPDANEPTDVNASRRRFAKAGLAGSAVLVTLASRPVFGETCPTPSAAGSGNHSQHVLSGTACPGIAAHDPNYWKTALSGTGSNQTFTGTSIKTNAKFHDIFSQGSNLKLFTNGNQSYSLLDVLNNSFTNPGAGFNKGEIIYSFSMGAWFVAALLGASSSPGDFGASLKATGSDPSVTGIEDEYAKNKQFLPIGGKVWLAQDIVDYFKNPWSVL